MATHSSILAWRILWTDEALLLILGKKKFWQWMSCVRCILMGRDRQEWMHNLCMCGCSVTQSCPTLCNPMDCSLPGSTVHGIFQASILEWGAISYSRASSWLRDQTQVSCISFTGRWIIYYWATWEAPCSLWANCKMKAQDPLFKNFLKLLRQWQQSVKASMSPGENAQIACSGDQPWR